MCNLLFYWASLTVQVSKPISKCEVKVRDLFPWAQIKTITGGFLVIVLALNWVLIGNCTKWDLFSGS